MSINDRYLTIAEKIKAAANTGKEAVFYTDPPLNTGNSYTFTPEGLADYFNNESKINPPPIFTDARSLKSFGIPSLGNDWTQVMESAIASGVPIIIPIGTFNIQGAVLKTNTRIIGEHEDLSVLRLADNSNKHLLMSEGADQLFGTTPSIVVPYDIYVQNLTLDGNRAANTSGCGIASYGRRLYFKSLKVKNIPDDGFKLEYADQASGPIGPNQSGSLGMEGGFQDITMDFIGGHGLNLRGPHDSYLYNIHVIHASQKLNNTYDAFHFNTGFNGRCFNLHAYNSGQADKPNHRYGLYDNTGGGLEVVLSHFEGSQTSNLYTRGQGSQFYGVRCYALRSPGRNVIIGAPQVRFQGVVSGGTGITGITLGLSGDFAAQCVIDATVTDCLAGSLDMGTSGGEHRIILRGNQTSGAKIIGVPAQTDDIDLQMSGTKIRQRGYSGSANVSAGGTNGTDAIALPYKVNRVTSATGNFGVKLPDSTYYTGEHIVVANVTASPIKVYPSTGDFIDNNTGGYVVVPVGKSASFFSTVRTAWAAVVSA